MYRSYLAFPRNIYLLFFAQIIGGTSASIVPLLGSLIGAEIAPSPTLVTFPPTSVFIGTAVGTIPAALLMKKIGRRNGFLLASILALFATILAAFSVSHHLFYLFCIASFFIGVYMAFVQQYRFSASESVTKSMAGKAVGFVLFAGIIAGIIGPEIAKLTKDMFSLPEFTGTFLILTILFALSAFLLLFLKDTHAQEEKIHEQVRPLKDIITRPRFVVAVVAGATSYAVMAFIMGAVPVHLHMLPHYTLNNIVFLSQSHVIGMYLPSLFTGVLMQRFGAYRMLLTGLAMYGLAIFFAVHAHSLTFYWIFAVLVGVGWNFLYIPATILLSQTHSHTERYKTQGVNDFIVFMAQVIASFLIGGVLLSKGWVNLNLFAIPLIVITFIIFTTNRKKITNE